MSKDFRGARVCQKNRQTDGQTDRQIATFRRDHITVCDDQRWMQYLRLDM